MKPQDSWVLFRAHEIITHKIDNQNIITKVHAETRQVWAHGRRVVECDPACIQSIYSFDALRILSKGENDHER